MTEGAVANRKRRPDRGSAARERRGPRRRRTPPTARSRPPHRNRPLETWQRTESNRSEVYKALRAERERVEKRMEEPRTQDGELFLLVLPNGSALSCRRPCATQDTSGRRRRVQPRTRRRTGNRARTPRTPAASCSAWLGSPQRHARRPPARHATSAPRSRQAGGAACRDSVRRCGAAQESRRARQQTDPACSPDPRRRRARTPRGPGRPGDGTPALKRSACALRAGGARPRDRAAGAARRPDSDEDRRRGAN